MLTAMNTSQPNTALLLLIAMSAVNTASDKREYYSATFQDITNPFSKPATRMFWSASNADKSGAVWLGGDPAKIAPLVGKLQIAGSIVSRTVPAYQIGENTVTTYTTAVFDSENLSTVFKSAGHPLFDDQHPAFVAPAEEAVI